MSKKKKVSMPPSSAGLISYYEEEGGGIKFKPEHIIVFTAVVIIFEMFLHLYG
jgi:preprotein translocase subunit Sec61beta